LANKISPLTTERIEELMHLTFSISQTIATSPKEGYSAFQAQWDKWHTQEKELVKPRLVQSLQFFIESGDAYVFPFREMICNAIINFMNDDLANKTTPPKLTKGSNFSQKQIAKLFYALKTKGAITNKHEQIALVISNTFDFNFNTILHYLKNPSEFEGVPDILST
jgi:hypothetical protein